jgi:hypothetical protein
MKVKSKIKAAYVYHLVRGKAVNSRVASHAPNSLENCHEGEGQTDKPEGGHRQMGRKLQERESRAGAQLEHPHPYRRPKPSTRNCSERLLDMADIFITNLPNTDWSCPASALAAGN